MSKKLPVQIRLHIRDLVEAKDGEIAKALKSLNTLIGSRFTLEIAWEDIHRDLQKSFENDVEKLVPNVNSHIVTLLTRLEALLEQDESFQEEFLEHYQSLVRVISVIVQDGQKTSCKIANNRLTLQLPTTGDNGFMRAQKDVGSDLTSLFKGGDATSNARLAVADPIKEDPDWDAVDIAPVEAKVTRSKPQDQSGTKLEGSSPVKPRPLPSLQSLLRPEVLFENALPAYVMIKGHDRELIIEGTHAPTMDLIAGYFMKYARKDMQNVDQSPRFRVETVTSNFGSGTITDRILVELWNMSRPWRINISMFLTFVEGVCEYDLVDSKTGSYLFKRTLPF